MTQLHDTARYTTSDEEPTVSEMLQDPIMKLLMHYDGVTEEQVRALNTERSWERREAA